MRSLPKFNDPNLVVGTEGFSDAGVYQLRDDLLIVQSLDFFPPLIDDPFIFGQIAAANSLSDIYAMGATPKTALNIVGFPDDKLDLDILSEILRGGADRVQLAGAVVAGGHTVRDTEIKYGLSVTGVAEPSRLFTNQTAKPGDALILTKALGTGFVTTAFKANRCPDDVINSAVESMVQLNATGSDAAHEVRAHAMTDITGFGLGGHACEMAQSSKVTFVIELDCLPPMLGAIELLRKGFRTRASVTNRDFAKPKMTVDNANDPERLELLFDPQTSGGLLISVPEARAEELVAKTREAGSISACRIGSVIDEEDVSLIIR